MLHLGMCVVLCLVFAPILVILAFRWYIRYPTRWNRSYTCLIGKTCIVTGANTGIGYYTALDFAKRGARVLLACRNETTATEAKNKIKQATSNENVHVRIVNFASLASVRSFCERINKEESRIDILVNNAGAYAMANKMSQDNLQITWQVNHFAPFLLTNLLLDKLKASTPSRIVVVSSTGASYCPITLQDLNVCKNLRNRIATNGTVYGRTKTANVLFARHLAKRLHQSGATGVNVYVLHPGIVNTDFLRRSPDVLKPIINFIYKIVSKTAEEGAQTTIYCAVSKEVENHTGQLYDSCRRIEMYDTCLDMNIAADLWNASAKLVDIS